MPAMLSLNYAIQAVLCQTSREVERHELSPGHLVQQRHGKHIERSHVDDKMDQGAVREGARHHARDARCGCNQDTGVVTLAASQTVQRSMHKPPVHES